MMKLFGKSAITRVEERTLDGSKSVKIAAKRERRPRESDLTAEHHEVISKVRDMPKEVGVLLIVSGIGGILLPGPVGTPFLLLGCLMLWPKAFRQTGICFEKWFPRMHYHGVKQINRFLDDLEKRYPLPK
jgi:hypothetical protein